MSRLLLSLVVLLLVCVCLLPSVNGADSQSRPTTAHGRKPNYSQKYLPTRPKKEMKRQEVKDLPNYVPTMAYHEEPTRPPMPLWQAHWDVEDFHSSGNYDLEMSNVVDNAKYYANSLTVGPKTTWVFDIDETVLSGYEEMKSWGFGYVPKLSNEWIMNSSAPAIPQTKALYQQLIGSGFKIVFLTGRPYTQHDATIMNLVNQGFDKFDTVITRQEDELKMTAAEYKTKRRTILAKEEGYEIVGCVGDQWSDLHGEFTGFKVKLPNYIYLIP